MEPCLFQEYVKKYIYALIGGKTKIQSCLYPTKGRTGELRKKELQIHKYIIIDEIISDLYFFIFLYFQNFI